MDNLFQNRLFLQYLSGAGGAMSAGQPIGPALNQATQQNITAQSYKAQQGEFSKMFQAILAGGGKINLDKENVSIKAPKAAFNAPGGGGTELAQEGSQQPGGSGIDWTKPENLSKLSGILNPSASPLDTTGADLAGLTPQMISQALSDAGSVEVFKQKRITDLANMIYKGSLTEYTEALTEKARTPGIPKDTRTTAIKNFEYAQSVKGGAYVGSFEEWEKDAKTTHQKEYTQAVKEGYKGDFHSWLRDMTALGGGLNLEEKITEKEAFADVKAWKYFTDPKGLPTDVDKYINSEEVQNKLFALPPEERDKATVREKEKHIVGKITAAGGIIDWSKSRVEGRTFIFVVKKPDGKIIEVRYAN